MAVTQGEVLELFSSVAAIKDTDQFLIGMANSQTNGVTAAKVTASLLRAYLNAGFAITIDSDGYICIGGVRTNTIAGSQRVIHQTDTQLTIQPNVLNVWGVVSGLAIDFASGAEGRVNEYMLQFTCPSGHGTSLALPPSVKWMNGDELETEAGWTYQVSIVNNLAVYAGWEN